jgi:hypothetical protein
MNVEWKKNRFQNNTQQMTKKVRTSHSFRGILEFLDLLSGVTAGPHVS